MLFSGNASYHFSSFPIFIMYNFFKAIPYDVIEAARIDGAREYCIFLKIGIPAGLPGIAASMILQFVEYWNVIEQPLIFLEEKETWPLSLYIPNINMENLAISFVAAMVTMIPALLIFKLGQNSLEAGIGVMIKRGKK